MIKTKAVLIQELSDLEEEFEYLESPMEKIEFIMDFAKESEVDESLIDEEKYLVRGCVSRAYLKIDIKNSEDSSISLNYFADAMIIKGFFGLIKQLLDDSKAEDLLKNIEELKKFSSNVGLESFLSPNRSNALSNIFNKIESNAN
mgnify:CR=1 FL=1